MHLGFMELFHKDVLQQVDQLITWDYNYMVVT
jgi:hypothetical protein